MANSGISGRFCAVKIGSTPVVYAGVQNWAVEESIVELDATTAADSGYTHPQGGLQSATATFTAVIDVTGGTMTALRAGTVVTDLGLWADTSSTSPIYLFASALITRSVPKGEVNGKFSFDVTARSIGSYTYNEPN